MNNDERQFENFVRQIKLDDTPDPDHRDKLEHDLLRTLTKQPRRKETPLKIWRIIMKSKMRKFAAAVVVITVLIGVYQFGGGRAAFAQTTKVVRTSLAGLKEFILAMGTREPEPPSPILRADPGKQSPDAKCKSILVNVHVYSMEGEQGNLWDFFERECVELVPAGNNPNTWYAKLDPDKAERFTELAHAIDELELRSSPSLMLREGQEGIIGSSGTEDLALALVANVLEDDECVELSFSFLYGQSGFEFPSIRIKMDKAVLVRLVTTTANKDMESDKDNHNRENSIFVLIRTKVLSPT